MSRATRTSRVERRRGYTLVEVMVALSILAVGVTGILSMENAAVLSNRRAQEMTIATNVARRWVERLRADALMWNTPSQVNPTSDLARDTQYLCAIVGCPGGVTAVNQWFVPVPRAGTDTAAFDPFGNEVALGRSDVKFCTNMRLNWLRPETAGRQGVLRAEVRVWWYREGVSRDPAYADCGTAAGLAALSSDINTVQAVYLATAVSGTPL